MLRHSEAIVLRQTKILKGRSMVTLLTKDMGKLSCGASFSAGGRSKSALAIRPFTQGQYNINVSERNDELFYNISSCEVTESHFDLGERYGRFAGASLAIEFTDHLLIEGAPVPDIYGLMADFLDIMCRRERAFETLTAACLIKLMQEAGVWPDRDNFSGDELLSRLNKDIIDELDYIMRNPIMKMEGLALSAVDAEKLTDVALGFAGRHLDIGELHSYPGV